MVFLMDIGYSTPIPRVGEKDIVYNSGNENEKIRCVFMSQQ